MGANDFRVNAYKKIAAFTPEHIDSEKNTGAGNGKAPAADGKKGAAPGGGKKSTAPLSPDAGAHSRTQTTIPANSRSQPQFRAQPLVQTQQTPQAQAKPTSAAFQTQPLEKLVKVTAPDPARPVSELMDRYGMVKVARPADPPKDSIYRRVAKFLLIIGVDEAAKILPHLTPEQTERIVPEIASIRSVDPDEAAVILAQFQNMVQKARSAGGIDTARSILEKAFGKSRAEEMIQKTVPFPDGKPFDYMKEMDGTQVFVLLKDESAPVRALVLSYLNPKIAAAVINQLEPEEKKDVVRRLARLEKMPPDIIRRIDRAMHEKVQAASASKSDAIDGRGALAEILKRMPPDAEKDILANLAGSDPELGQDLRDRLFTVDDILKADDRFIQKKLQTLPDADIARLIAGKNEPFRMKILSNVSKGRGDSILEEEQLGKPFRKEDCRNITDAFFSELRRAWENGTLYIAGTDDVYV